MNRLYYLFLMIWLSTTDVVAQSIFEEIGYAEDVTHFSINDKMFKIIASMQIDLDSDEREILDIIGGIKKFNVIESTNQSINQMLDEWIKDQHKDGFVELMKITENDTNVSFLVKESSNGELFEQFLMYVTDPPEDFNAGIYQGSKNLETVILSIEGSIDLHKLSKIASRMDFPGSERIKESLKNEYK